MKCYVRATASMPQIVKLVEKRGMVSSSGIKAVLMFLPLWGIARRRWYSRGCREMDRAGCRDARKSDAAPQQPAA